MKRIVKLVTGITAGLSGLYWAAGSVLALPLNLCSNDIGQGANINKLCAVETNTIVEKGIQIAMYIAFVAALSFLIYGGIRWVISGGDKENTAKAKGTVTAALIGLALVVGSWIMLNVLLKFFGSASGLTNLNWVSLIP